tara:strand:+ start:24488 stop:25645 length:1158 start_codon:yes stop_codon:yes gene_type:complete
MTSISSGLHINSPNVTAIDLRKLDTIKVAESDEKTFQNYIQKSEKILESVYTKTSEPYQNPRNKDYATVTVDGEIVAEIDNNGFVKTSNNIGKEIKTLFSSEDIVLKGPELAQSRSEKIADFLGGEIINSSTAMSQKEFDFSPRPVSKIDFLAGTNSAKETQEIQKLTNSFNSWESEYLASGVGQDRIKALSEHGDKFVGIMAKAVKENGYNNPQQFIKSLSTEELETLRVVSSLAESIKPDELGKEGALNLLLPRSEHQDLDNDGFTMNGIGRSWSFPPPNAPESVKLAWDEATSGMSPGDKMLAMIPFMPILIMMDSNGQVHEVEPTEANNIYASKDFSYTGYVQDRLEALEYFRAQTPVEQYERQKEFLTKFLGALNNQDVA